MAGLWHLWKSSRSSNVSGACDANWRSPGVRLPNCVGCLGTYSNTHLASSAGQLLRELRDAAEGEGVLLRQYHELSMPGGPATLAEKGQVGLKQDGRQEASQPLHASSTPRLYSSVDGTLPSHHDAANGKAWEGRVASPHGRLTEAKAASEDTAVVVPFADSLATHETYSRALQQSDLRHEPPEIRPAVLSEPPKANKCGKHDYIGCCQPQIRFRSAALICQVNFEALAQACPDFHP
ncbi:hypothetical protein Emag_003929 [Eimeria magna]